MNRLKSVDRFLTCRRDKEKHDRWNLAQRIKGSSFLAMLPTASSSPMSGPIESVFTGKWTRARTYPCKVRWPRERVSVCGHTTAGGCVLLLNWTLLSVRERRSNGSGVLGDHPCTQRPRPSLSVNHCSTRVYHFVSILFCFISPRSSHSLRVFNPKGASAVTFRERILRYFILECKIILYR